VDSSRSLPAAVASAVRDRSFLPGRITSAGHVELLSAQRQRIHLAHACAVRDLARALDERRRGGRIPLPDDRLRLKDEQSHLRQAVGAAGVRATFGGVARGGFGVSELPARQRAREQEIGRARSAGARRFDDLGSGGQQRAGAARVPAVEQLEAGLRNQLAARVARAEPGLQREIATAFDTGRDGRGAGCERACLVVVACGLE
jgi:hypothetical protein